MYAIIYCEKICIVTKSALKKTVIAYFAKFNSRSFRYVEISWRNNNTIKKSVTAVERGEKKKRKETI